MKGFQQEKSIDFDEIFSPVVKMMSIRVVLGLVASQDLELEKMDVKTAFLHGLRGGDLHGTTKRVYSSKERAPRLQVEEKFVWSQTSTETMVQKI